MGMGSEDNAGQDRFSERAAGKMWLLGGNGFESERCASATHADGQKPRGGTELATSELAASELAR